MGLKWSTTGRISSNDWITFLASFAGTPLSIGRRRQDTQNSKICCWSCIVNEYPCRSPKFNLFTNVLISADRIVFDHCLRSPFTVSGFWRCRHYFLRYVLRHLVSQSLTSRHCSNSCTPTPFAGLTLHRVVYNRSLSFYPHPQFLYITWAPVSFRPVLIE